MAKTYLVKRPGVPVEQDLHALLHDVGRLLARERVLVALDRLAQQRLSAVKRKRESAIQKAEQEVSDR